MQHSGHAADGRCGGRHTAGLGDSRASNAPHSFPGSGSLASSGSRPLSAPAAQHARRPRRPPRSPGCRPSASGHQDRPARARTDNSTLACDRAQFHGSRPRVRQLSVRATPASDKRQVSLFRPYVVIK